MTDKEEINLKKKWSAMQRVIAEKVKLKDERGLSKMLKNAKDRKNKDGKIKIAGVDLSFPKDKPRRTPNGDEDADTLAAIVVMEYGYGAPEIIHESFMATKLKQPYIPNFLAFREADPLEKLITHLRENFPKAVPDVILVDGNGILHTRNCGIASHLGVSLDIPTIGVAKKLLCVQGLNDDDVCHVTDSHITGIRGRSRFLKSETGQTLGVAYRNSSPVKSRKTKYISPGHLININTSTAIVDYCCERGLSEPSPIRYADRHGRYLLDKYKSPRKALDGMVDKPVTPAPDTFSNWTCFDDIDHTCFSCKGSWVLEAGEQEFYSSKGIRMPNKCKPCRSRT